MQSHTSFIELISLDTDTAECRLQRKRTHCKVDTQALAAPGVSAHRK